MIMNEETNLYVFIIIKDKNDNIIKKNCVYAWAVLSYIMNKISYGVYGYGEISEYTPQEMQEMKYLEYTAVINEHGGVEIGKLIREIDIKPYLKDIPKRIERNKQSPACSLRYLGE